MQNDTEGSLNSEYEHGTFYKNFSKYLKGSLDCGNYYEERINKKPCYAPNAGNNVYKSLNGAILGNSGERLLDDGILVMPDSSILYFENNKEGDSAIYVSVDLNGIDNGPNIWGYDLFTFEFLNGELRTMGATGTRYTDLNTYCSKSSGHNYNGIACADKAKTNSEYFKEIAKELK